MSVEIKVIDEQSSTDINLKNEEFELVGRFIPKYLDENWSYDIQMFPKEKLSSQVFPDENYDYNLMKEDHIFVGAYVKNEIVGLAIYKHNWNKYLYLYDLKVNTAFRNRNIASQLIEKGRELAEKNNYQGIYTQAQDNNLIACKFYVHTGFEIGGFDNKIYDGTKQSGKADVIFYLDI